MGFNMILYKILEPTAAIKVWFAVSFAVMTVFLTVKVGGARK